MPEPGFTEAALINGTISTPKELNCDLAETHLVVCIDAWL
jgi:hypothetical protein